MKTIALEQSATTRLFWLLAGLLGALIILTFKQSDPAVAAAGFVLILVSLLPLYLWLLGWSHGLPIWPVFCLSTGATFALALTQGAEDVMFYTPGEILVGTATMCGFILLGTVFWISFTARIPKAPGKLLMIQNEHAIQYLFWFIAAGILFYVNGLVGLIQYPGNTMPVVRGITLSLNYLGIFTLCYYHGRGLLTKAQVVLLGFGIVATILLSLTSLMIASAIVPAGLAIFGLMLGSNRLPWLVLVSALACVALLHPGKWEMRSKYWGFMGTEGLTLTTLPQFYGEWFGYGFTHVGGISGILQTQIGAEEDGKTSAFERAGNAHMLLLVQRKSPAEVPFLGGITYAHIPRMLIPRFLDPEKGISHTGNILLTVNYGLQTLEQTATTSIGWGLVPEAYANFGYLGVAALAFVLAGFYSIFTRLSVGVPMTSLRFVLGLLVMAASTKTDTMGIFVTTQFQGMVGVSLAAMLLMRRLPNPFAATNGSEARRAIFGGRSEFGALPAQFAPAGVKFGAGLTEDSANPETGSRDLRVGRGSSIDAGVVRNIPTRMPKRITSWMPRRMRAAVVAAARSAEETGDSEQGTEVKGPRDQESKRPKDGRERPRQLAVPYQNYRRYRG